MAPSLTAILLLLSSVPAFGQGSPAFEVAEVKVNKSGDRRTSVDFLPGGQIRLTNASMRVLITVAWRVRPDAMSGEPGWIDADRFDVIAKSTPEASPDGLRRMLQTLLAERFKLAAHKQDKVTAAYALVAGKNGLKLKQSEPARPGERRCDDAEGPPYQIHVACKHITMAELADTLPNLAPRYITMPVVDQTGLKGSYEFQLDWTPMAAPAGSPPDGGPTIETAGGFTIFDAVAKLGLKLEKAKLPVPVVVVDHIERTLVDN